MFRHLVTLILIYMTACMIFGWGVPANRFESLRGLLSSKDSTHG